MHPRLYLHLLIPIILVGICANLFAQATEPPPPADPEALVNEIPEDASLAEEPAPDYTGPVTISRIRIVIDGYTWIWDDPGQPPRPGAANDPELRVSLTRPETIMGLIGIAPGDRFGQAELDALAARREKELGNSNQFFNNSIAILPVPSDPAKRALVVDVKMGFTLRPSAGGAFVSLTDLNVDGNFLVFGATLGFNNNSLTIGHGIAQAGPFWWQANLAYSNDALSTLGTATPVAHTVMASAAFGSAWLPLSPFVTAFVWGRFADGMTPPAPWAVSFTPHLSWSESLKSGDFGLGFGVQGQSTFSFYAPDWQPVVQPEVRVAIKPSFGPSMGLIGPVELAVQGSFAYSNLSPLDEFSLNLLTPDRGLRGGFATIKEVYVDRLLLGNVELRWKALNFPLWILDSLGIWPFAYLDLAASSRAAEPDWFGHQALAAGGGLRLWLGIPVMLGFTFSYGWSDRGIGAFNFAVSTGF